LTVAAWAGAYRCDDILYSDRKPGLLGLRTRDCAEGKKGSGNENSFTHDNLLFLVNKTLPFGF
jgi:hypothetical protein